MCGIQSVRKVKGTIYASIYGILSLFLILGCTKTMSRFDSQPTKSERLLEVEIKDDLRRSPYVPAHAITVMVRDGHVQLSGLVESPPQAEQAEIIAQVHRGVESIENRIEVR